MVHFSVHRFTLIPQERLVFPGGNAGSTLRGAFGHSLKRIVCVDRSADCPACPLAETCVYQVVFSPVQDKESPGPKRQRTPPRGFVIKPPLSNKAEYPPGEPFVFDFLLVGRLGSYLPYIIVPLKELGEVGVGSRRTKFVLEEISSVKPAPAGLAGIRQETVERIYHARDGTVRNIDGRVTLSDLMLTPDESCSTLIKSPFDKGGHGGITRLTLDFLTPTQLRYNPSGEKGRSQVVRQPEFHHIAKRLRDRIDALARFYCDSPFEIDHKAFGERAEGVRTVSRDLRWVEQFRRSRAGHRHDLSGFVGQVTFEGNLTEFLPFLILGQHLHVGENAVFGSGRYEIEMHII